VFLVGLLEHRNRTVLKMGHVPRAVTAPFAAELGLLATF
jgi:hypothetical protein